MNVTTDCAYFRGDVPCVYNKQFGAHCDDCVYYRPISRRILIIKLGAIGDIIRTTPLVRRLKADDPSCEISWLTYHPEVVPSIVDQVYAFDLKSFSYLQGTSFDVLYNLDKEKEACGLAMRISAERKFGFGIQNGKCAPLNEMAQQKWLTGLFDDISRSNQKSYQEEVFEMCGLCFAGEKYLLDKPNKYTWSISRETPVIGLNTGCGGRWVSRLWPEIFWLHLAQKLRGTGYTVILLGGADEHEQNRRLARESGALYFGYFPLPQFIDLVDQCSLVVTTVTMALHIAIGCEKKIVLLNNIFNRHEFELYNLGVIVEPAPACRCFYQSVCAYSPCCMATLSAETVFAHCQDLLLE